ncbi:hypothetical protein AGRA3207_007478 [Actinomadura graeca]|uniref:Uncharacterized protein n=1 Tax=Actinomadura graeca TaxID=2750812 RepID=A0ABX8R667_9ACTN|nr:hypothetical protein [Actinomadura graeca]QXJ25909.1 hypothetical protein AGRA3207_007478 [Actinomadura graeca]
MTEVPYKLVAGGDDADRFIAMYLTNAGEQRSNHSPWEQTRALFMACQAGASKTEIRKSLGLKADQVRQAVKAGRLTDEQVAAAHEIAREWTIEEYGLLGEFSEDQEALDRLTRMKAYRGSVAHEAALMRRERSDTVEHQRIRERLAAEGVPSPRICPAAGCG